MPNRLEKLVELEERLYASMEVCESKSLASIARQYRETIREIDEIRGMEVTDDGIGEILSAREADGKSTADRKSRS